MYCPECLAEYREGFTQCSDCRVPLLAGNPPATESDFDPSLNPVVVFESADAVKAAMAQGVLDDAGIPYVILNRIATLVQEVDPTLYKAVKIQVAVDREQEAREVLELLETPEPLAEGADVD
jgi:hypothetical protein